MNSKYLCFFCIAVLIAGIIGCSSEGLKGVVPATGTVNYDNGPVDGAHITFIPVDKSGEARTASAITRSDGTFSLKTLSFDGIYPGEYTVVVMKTENSTNNTKEDIDSGRATKGTPKHLLPAKYASISSTDLKVTIPPEGDQAIVIDLK